MYALSIESTGLHSARMWLQRQRQASRCFKFATRGSACSGLPGPEAAVSELSIAVVSLLCGMHHVSIVLDEQYPLLVVQRLRQNHTQKAVN